MRRLLVATVIAPVALCVIGVAIVDANHDAGLAPIPFLLTAYALGLAIWGIAQLVVPRRFALTTALIALVVCAVCVITDTNARLALWAIGAPGVGGLAATMPLTWRDYDDATGSGRRR